jgi:uncharacterized membrane protein
MEMKMKNKNALILSVVSFIAVLAFYPFLPEEIPLHWNSAGVVDGWGNKLNIFWIAGLPVATIFLFEFLPKIDPKPESYKKHKKAFGWIIWLTVITFIGISWMTVAFSMGFKFDVSIVMRLSIGALFIGLGNYMGQIRQNYFVGIKTPWTLANETVWKKTHRRGAVVFVLMGLAVIISIIFPSEYLASIIISVTLGGTGYLILYSYLEFRKINDEKN